MFLSNERWVVFLVGPQGLTYGLDLKSWPTDPVSSAEPEPS
jgi:hypothetical protein